MAWLKDGDDLITRKPLEGVTVADFTWVGAGAFATKLLADNGANVVKIESRAKPDGVRLSPPFKNGVEGFNRSGYFADRNSSKRSLSLNLKTERAREIALEIACKADVVANNFTPGVMERFGLGYDTIAERNPGVIYLAMSMQGSTGPESNYLGYGQTIGASVGLQHLMALPGMGPVGTGTNYPDHVPNPAHAAFAVLAALWHRDQTGAGQFIDLAQTEPTLSGLPTYILSSSFNDVELGGVGNSHQGFCPHSIYRCSGEDDWVAIAVTNDDQWAKLAEWIGHPHAAEEFGTVEARKSAERTIDELIASAVEDLDACEVESELKRRGIACARVIDAHDALHDAELVARGHWKYLDHPEMGRSVYGMQPFRFSRSPNDLTKAAPCLGQHNYEILHEFFGMTEDRVNDLIEEKVVY